MNFFEKASILKKIIIGVSLASLFLLLQLLGIFFSNRENVERLNEIDSIQRASTKADKMDELIDTIFKFAGNLPEEKSDIKASLELNRQNFSLLSGYLKSLQTDMSSLKHNPELLSEADASLEGYWRAINQIFEYQLKDEDSRPLLQTEKVLAQQYRATSRTWPPK